MGPLLVSEDPRTALDCGNRLAVELVTDIANNELNCRVFFVCQLDTASRASSSCHFPRVHRPNPNANQSFKPLKALGLDVRSVYVQVDTESKAKGDTSRSKRLLRFSSGLHRQRRTKYQHERGNRKQRNQRHVPKAFSALQDDHRSQDQCPFTPQFYSYTSAR